MDKRILIIGASGLIGSYIARHFLRSGGFDVLGADFECGEADIKKLDIRDEAAVKNILDEFHPEVVIVPAAIPNVELCETNPQDTRPTNIDGMKNIISHLPPAALLIYFSSDYIFDGANGPYDENDTPNPLSEYGRQKLEIEEDIKKTIENYLILRTAVVYGWESKGKNFVMQTLKRLGNGDKMTVPADQISNATFAGDIAEAVERLIDLGVRGVFNVAGKGILNRYEFTKSIAKIFDLHAENIKPVSTSELNQKAKRPLNGGLKIEKLESYNIKMSDAKEGLIKMKRDMFRVLMISLDKSVCDAQSASAMRMKDYGSICDELHIIVLGAAGENLKLTDNVFVYPTSSNRFFALSKTRTMGEKILSGRENWVITAQDPFEAGLISWCLAKRFHAGLEVQLHGDFYGNNYWRKERLINFFRFYLGKFVLRRAKVVRVVSERIEKSIKKITKADVFRNPIYFEPLRDDRSFLRMRDKGTPEILAVGNLVDVKNHGLLLESFAELKKENLKSAGLFVVGDGYKMEELERRASSLGLKEKDVLIVMKRDLKAYYEQADIFVHPSLYEGWGRAVVEAASFGLPIVMSNVGLAGEVIKNDESGLIVPVNDKEALKNAIIKLAQDEALRKRLGEGAKRAVSALPDKERYLNKIKEAWQSASK